VFADTASVPAGCTVCSWCQKVASSKHLFSLKTPTGQKAFCSEVCFTQCRRANFKRNKTCDWCRHVRHTVNYVDFQDGEHQLQFCRCDKLKFKLQVFCFVSEISDLKQASALCSTSSYGSRAQIGPWPPLWGFLTGLDC
jgi:hypothetical protein